MKKGVAIIVLCSLLSFMFTGCKDQIVPSVTPTEMPSVTLSSQETSTYHSNVPAASLLASDESALPSKISSKTENGSTDTSSVNTASLNQQYDKLLSQQPKGYELLIRAPKNPNQLTQKQIELMFGLELPDEYKILNYSFHTDKECYNRPQYAMKIQIDSKDTEKLIDSLSYHKITHADYDYMYFENTVDWWDMDKTKVNHGFLNFETLYFKASDGIVKTSGSKFVFIMNDSEDKTAIYLNY